MQVNADIDAIKSIRINVIKIVMTIDKLSRRLYKQTERVSQKWNDKKYVQFRTIIDDCLEQLNNEEQELLLIVKDIGKIIKELEAYENEEHENNVSGITTSSSERTENEQTQDKSEDKEGLEIFGILDFLYEIAMEYANSNAGDVIGKLTEVGNSIKEEFIKYYLREWCDQLTETKWSDAAIACSSVLFAWSIVKVLACPPSVIIYAPGMIGSLSILRKQRKAVKEGSSVKYCDITGLSKNEGMTGGMMDVAEYLKECEERDKINDGKKSIIKHMLSGKH